MSPEVNVYRTEKVLVRLTDGSKTCGESKRKVAIFAAFDDMRSAKIKLDE